MSFSFRYATIYQLSCVPHLPNQELTMKQAQKEMLLWKPLSDYGQDSIYSITPPTVPKESKRIYDACCRVVHCGPRPPLECDIELYDQYNKVDVSLEY